VLPAAGGLVVACRIGRSRQNASDCSSFGTLSSLLPGLGLYSAAGPRAGQGDRLRPTDSYAFQIELERC